MQYRGTAPVFVTSKLEDIKKLAWWAEDDPDTGAPRSAEASMMYRRLKVYPYTKRIAKPPPQIYLFADVALRILSCMVERFL